MLMQKTIVVAVIAVTICVGSIVTVGAMIAAPRLVGIGAPPAEITAESINIPGTNAASIAGWFIPGKADSGSVLLLHGIRANRTQMIGRAKFLNDAGYSVLLIDMQAHGETAGTHITFGYRESRDVRDAVAFLRSQNPHHAIGVLGVSLGGAAILLGNEPLKANAVVVEAVYNNIAKAAKNRLKIRLGSVGQLLAPLLLWQIGPRLGIELDSLSPSVAIAHLQSPVMIIAGENDQRTTLADSRDLYDNASEPKILWIVPGAKHEDFHRKYKKEYESRVLGFLQKHMGSTAT